MRTVFSMAAAVFLTAAAPLARSAENVFESSAPVLAARNPIDKLVLPQLARAGLHPALCSDAVFVRRAYLDVLGILPAAQAAREFIEDPNPDKRARLIERLLNRPEFADYWAMRWGDALRIKAEFPVNLWPNAAQAYARWVHAALAQNQPYDRFARELLTSSGSNFRVGPVNFYRAVQNRTPEGLAGAVALTFMGTRVEAWPSNRLAAMAVFFAQVGYKPTREWKEECVFWDPSGGLGTNNAAGATGLPTNLPPQLATFPDGRQIRLTGDRDPREVFADWLIRPSNPWFTRAIVNRYWAWLLGRGIIQEPDDIRDDNPPSNPALLAMLEKQMVAGHYDLKRFLRLVLNSSTYQLSSVPPPNPALSETNFGAYPLRRLDAEVLIDAIDQITGTTELYTSAIPEPFTFIPADEPAVALADGSVTSPFLALFGRSARATGMDNERNNKMLAAQWLHLLNSSHIQRKLEQGPWLKRLLGSGRKPPQLVEELYLTILSRFPTAEEVQAITDYARPGRAGGRAKTREDWVDLAWALINSTEFLYRH